MHKGAVLNRQEVTRNYVVRQFFWVNVLDSFSCIYIEIAYSNFTFCGTYTLIFFLRN